MSGSSKSWCHRSCRTAMRIQESLCAVFDNCGDAVIVVSASQEHLLDGKIVYVNNAFRAQTGLTLQELEGESAQRVLAGAVPEIRGQEKSAFDLDSKAGFNLRLRSKDGSEAP